MKRHSLSVNRHTRGTITQTQECDDKEVAPVVQEMLEEPLTPKSIMFLHGDSLHILVTFGLGSPASLELLREKLPLTLLKHPRFSSVLVGDTQNGSEDLKWVQIPHVNIDDHIIFPRINPALNKGELHVLNLKTSEADCTAIFRIHHSIGDGASLVSILVACTRQTSNPEALPRIPILKMAKKEEKNLVLLVVRWLQVLWNTINGVLMLLATTFFLKDSDLLMPREETRAKPRSFVHRTVSLDDMKLVKNATNATLNDVALGMIEAGFAKNLIRKFNDGEEEKKKANNNILKNIRVRMALVFNLRPPTENQGLADMMDKDNKVKGRNHIGFVLLPLSIRMRNDPLDYVRNATAKVDRKKRSLEALYSVKIGEIAMKLFGIKAAALMSKKAVNIVSVVLSNMPGPLEQISFYGNPIKFIAPAGYGQLNAVKINLLSYMNKMSFIVSVREDVNIDSHQLCDDIVESLTLIKGAIQK